MENSNDSNQINEEKNEITDENVVNDANPDINSTPNNLELQPKKSRKKLFILLIIVLILIAGGAAAYFLLNQDKQSATPAASSAAEETPKNQPTKLFAQLGEEIIAYDTATTESNVITDKVPKDSTVIDFYYNSDDDWRYYATDGFLGSKIYFANQSSEPEAVSSAKSVFSVVANAEKKIFAYEKVGTYDGQTSKTYLVTDNGKPQLIYESDKGSSGQDDSKDLKSFRYVVGDISSSGDEILYQQQLCFECGGGQNSNLFKLNIKTKKTEIINNKNTELAFPAYFNKDDNVILTSGDFSFPWNPIEDINITSYLFKDGKKSEIFKIDDKKSESYSLSQNGDLVLTRLKDKNYTKTGNTLPGQFYSLNNGQAEELSVDLGEYDSAYEYSLGNSIGDCVAASFYNRDTIAETADYSVGVICKDHQNIYQYSTLDNIKSNTDYNLDVVYQLL